MIRRIYYRIWTDAIRKEKSKPVEGESWKAYSLVPISILMGMNLLTFMYWMKALNKNLPLYFYMDIFNARPLNGFVSVLFTLFFPFVILNYLLVFSNNQYLKFTSIYPAENGKLYRKYIYITLGLLFIPILLQKLFFQTV